MQFIRNQFTSDRLNYSKALADSIRPSDLDFPLLYKERGVFSICIICFTTSQHEGSKGRNSEQCNKV